MSAPDRIGLEPNYNAFVDQSWGNPSRRDDGFGVEYIRADLVHQWQPIETAPMDGSWFWGKIEEDAISMRWHDEFDDFVSSWREMTFAASYGGGTRLHSPDVETPAAWMRRVY